jgi:hypothetical protein
VFAVGIITDYSPVTKTRNHKLCAVPIHARKLSDTKFYHYIANLRKVRQNMIGNAHAQSRDPLN